MRAKSDRRSLRQSAAAACAVLFLLSALSARAETMAPVADAKAVVVSGQARFTVLAPRLIRMEWSGASEFEDRASLVFIDRRQPVPPFTSVVKGGWLTITTDALTLRYKTGSGAFTASNLEVRFTLDRVPVVWHPGLEDKGNLLGTTRTLDGVNGPATKLEPGLISRDGWVVVDDSTRLLYDGSDWPWVTPRPVGKRQDLYFFGYGHDYRGALADFTKVAGRIPMPPRFAFGIWWSRYWAYSDEEFEQLVREFEARTLPLDVLVVDMDWHLTFGGAWDNNPKDQSGHTKGWTGFTWDKNYFPDPAGFLDWTDAHGLRTPLNLHPASGIQPWESQYPAMAKSMGIDPASQKYVPFDIVDKKFATNFFDLVIHPLEKQGVDFWWLDWQQSDKTSLEGINPTWWLNYAFFTDMERQGKRRPLIFHRWGGLGNHRYEIGFSGDTYSTWQSLAYQPYFTATAANVGFGYWSHDIGGHMNGPVEPELYTRWIQFGVFSPILRTHTTKNPGAERRIWAYPPAFSDAMREAFLLRSSLIPYIYTASRGTYDTGVPFLRPLYWDSPEAIEAYVSKDEYLFGDSLLVAPIVAPRDKETGLATRSVWLPAGSWVEWSSGRVVDGPATITRHFAIDEIPVYVKGGAVIPMQQPVERAGQHPTADPLVLEIFPPGTATTRIYDERREATTPEAVESGSTTMRVYEDQGDSTAYQAGEGAWTTVRVTRDRGVRTIRIEPVQGQYAGMPSARGYEIRLRNLPPPQRATVGGGSVAFATATGRDRRAKEGLPPARAEWWYEGETATIVILVPACPVSGATEVRVELDAGATSAGARPGAEVTEQIAAGFAGTMRRLHDLLDLVNGGWPGVAPPELLLTLVQAGNRMSIDPARAATEFELVRRKLPELKVTIDKLPLAADARVRANALLKEIGF
jgi:alpha-glucosidase